MTGEPPSDVGAIHDKLTSVFPAVAVSPAGAPGTAGVTDATAMPPAATVNPPTMVAARHVAASARSHGPARRRRLSPGGLGSAMFGPPCMSFTEA
jgi:hypothetical protein